jgi:glycosyltransferase involved in cell wall biosynthesis
VKVGLVVPGGFDAGGSIGVIPALLDLSRALARRHDVHVFVLAARGATQHYPLAGARVHRIGDPWLPEPATVAGRALGMARMAAGLARELRRAERQDGRGFDVLHAFWADGPGVVAGLVGRARRIRVVVSLGGGEAVSLPELDYGGARSRLGRARTALALSLATAITAGSAFAASFLSAEAARRARVVPLGISCEPTADDLRDDLGDDLPLRPPGPAGPPWRLLHVGTLNRIKDHPTLLRAFARVAARLGDVSLDCVGEDTLGGETQRLAATLGLGESVRFWGFREARELTSFYRRAHALVVSSRYESQGVVILEAAARGLPTVGTSVGLMPTLAPAAAVCVPPGDWEGLGDELTGLLLDETRRHALGEAAQRFARAHDASWTASTFEQLYAESQ